MLPPPLGREEVTLFAAAENKRITQKKRFSTEPLEGNIRSHLFLSRSSQPIHICITTAIPNIIQPTAASGIV
jgi:hypothetical protein